MKKFAYILDAMSNERRLKILVKLLDGERSVGLLADDVGISQSALSQHLAKLRTAKLVKTRRDTTSIYYSVSSPVVEKILAALKEVHEPDGADHTPDESKIRNI